VTNSSRTDDDVGRGAPTTVFVSDPSAEAERVSQALRAAGYVVVDVPQSMLVARVAVQRPKVILVDADTEGALDAVARVRELPDAEAMDVVFLARAGGMFRGLADALAHEGSGFFARPVDVQQLVEKVDALTGGARGTVQRRTTPPPSIPSSSSRPPAASLPPASMRLAEGMRPPSRNTPRPPASVSFMAPPMDVGPASMRRVTSVQAPLSNELEVLLQEAEQRIGGQMSHESLLPSPEEEIEAVLPAEVLASLDDPLEDEDEDDRDGAGMPALSRGSTTGAGRATTGGGTGAGTGTGAGVAPVDPTEPPASPSLRPGDRRAGAADRFAVRGDASFAIQDAGPIVASKTNPGTHHGATNAGTQHGVQTTGSRGMGTSESVRRDDLVSASYADRGERRTPAPSFDAPGAAGVQGFAGVPPASYAPRIATAPAPPPMAPPARSQPPTVLGPGDAARALGTAIATRATGVLTFESPEGMRRAVLREGDLVTAASSIDAENLLAFLAARGELPRDRVEQLAGRLPPFGRHAGAALVAHGYLRQDQLWSVLRAHAEWLLGRAIALESGSAILEPDAPGRLKGEPSVFGGSTGAEVLVEVVRRVVSPEDALLRLGGATSRLTDGPSGALLSECALVASELEWMQTARGRALGESLPASAEQDITSVVYALSLLGVVDVVRAAFAPRITRGGAPLSAQPPAVDVLDEEAIRARVRARMQLVDEGDYFAVLGVPRDATGYEVKRAFLELRRVFEPSRILTPRLSDLEGDVRKIADVLDEAYEILRDSARRERYRRAIELAPRAL
jgi:hypothetical protein